MRKLTYFVACTADGFIAREDGSFDFFPMDGEHLPYIVREFPESIPAHLHAALDVKGGNRHFDTVVMGRGTYEVGSSAGFTSPYPHMRQYVVSSTMGRSLDPSVELVANDPVGLVKRLKQAPGLGIWLCGGAKLAAALSDEIDDLILKVNPVLLGTGMPLFAGAVGMTRLELVDHRTFAGGVAIHHYEVTR
jgi:dihydrofolate reductase